MPKSATKGRAAPLAGLTCAWLLLACAPALAHANLLEASPSPGGEVSKPPERVELHFSEPVDAEFDPVVVRTAGGARVDAHDARVDPEDARVVLAHLESVPKGSYIVKWRVTSTDGHVVEGRYEFAVTDAREDQLSSDTQGAEGQRAKEHAGHAEREPAVQDGARDSSVPILAYSALSLGVLAVVAVAAFVLSRLARRPRA